MAPEGALPGEDVSPFCAYPADPVLQRSVDLDTSYKLDFIAGPDHSVEDYPIRLPAVAGRWTQ